MEGSTTFEELATSVGVDRSPLTRILRLGIANRVFREPQAGVIAHSAASRQLAEDVRIASWASAGADEMWPAAGRVVDALEQWPLAEEPTQTVRFKPLCFF